MKSRIKNLAEYKILASDLDGTLLDSSGLISKENLAAIHRLAQSGVHFVPASGRSLAEMPEELRACDDIRYFIHSSGAAVYDKLTGERISFCFPMDISRKIFDLLFEADCHLTVRHLGNMYTAYETMNEKSFEKYAVWKPHADLLRNVGKAIRGFGERFLSEDSVEMISVFLSDDERLLKLKAELSCIPDVNVASACPHNIELTYAKAGKGNALCALAHRLGVSIDETVAVGDSENDIPMINAAGLGLATSNACAEVISCAADTICSNDEHVIDFIAKNYF